MAKQMEMAEARRVMFVEIKVGVIKFLGSLDSDHYDVCTFFTDHVLLNHL